MTHAADRGGAGPPVRVTVQGMSKDNETKTAATEPAPPTTRMSLKHRALLGALVGLSVAIGSVLSGRGQTEVPAAPIEELRAP